MEQNSSSLIGKIIFPLLILITLLYGCDSDDSDGAIIQQRVSQCEYAYYPPTPPNPPFTPVFRGTICTSSLSSCSAEATIEVHRSGWIVTEDDVDLVLNQVDTCNSEAIEYVELPNSAISPRKILRVPLALQQTEVWCWATVIEMLSSYYGNRAFQCQTLSFWYGVDCCGFPFACNVPGTDFQIIESLNQLGISSSITNGPLSWQQAVQEIKSGRPFIMFYQGSFIGHVVVGYGYDSSRQTLLIHDPFFGSFEVPYGNTFSYGSQNLGWARTLHFASN